MSESDRPDPSVDAPSCEDCAKQATCIGAGVYSCDDHCIHIPVGSISCEPLPPPATTGQPDPQEEAARALLERLQALEADYDTWKIGEPYPQSATLLIAEALRAAHRQGFEEGQKAGRGERDKAGSDSAVDAST